MKRIKPVFFSLLILTTFFPAYCRAEAAPRYDGRTKSRVLALVVPTRTMADITEDCALRSEPNYLAHTPVHLKKGTPVEVLADRSESWYFVESADTGASGWLPAKSLSIREDATPVLPEMTAKDVEAFADIMNFPTVSGFFVWTDIARQKTHVLKKDGSFTLIKTLKCSTGKFTSPTTRGFFTINGRGGWFYSKRLKSGGMYWVRFNGSYLFHSYAMDKNKNVTDGVLGERRSSGCVRLCTEDARWIYKNIPDGTSVLIY